MPRYLLATLLLSGLTMTAHAQSERPPLRSLWDHGDAAKSEARFREAAAAGKQAGDENYRIQAMTQAARALGKQRRFAEGHTLLDAAETALASHDLPIARLRILLERGRLFDSPAHPKDARQTDKARPLFVRVWTDGKVPGGHVYAIDAAHMLGIIEAPDVAAKWNLDALAFAEKTTEPAARRWLGPLYNNMGWDRFEKGEFDAALDLFERGYAFRKAKGLDAGTVIARWSVGRAQRALGHFDVALATQQAVWQDWEAIGKPPSGYTSEELGECLLALGRADEAKPHFVRAYALLSKDSWFTANEPKRLARLATLADDSAPAP